MSQVKILFIDRDGTLIREPADFQVDSLAKLELVDGVIPALLELQSQGYRLVMVTNQDGLGTDSFPEADFSLVQEAMLKLFRSQGIHFDDTLVCPHFERDRCLCRKPHLGLVRKYLGQIDAARSAVIGDRATDMQLAENMGLRGFRLGEGQLTWPEITRALLATPRAARRTRATRETRISAAVDLDGNGEAHIRTGLGFFDHMLEQIAKHGGFDLRLDVEGDLQVDEHHTVEDAALTLGLALRDALGDKHGIERFGFALPMDEALAQASLDLSGRPYFVFEGAFPRERVGELPTELVPHFFRSLSDALGMSLHLSVKGENAHHMVEALFKCTGRALRMAFRRAGDTGLPSTKGTL